MMSYNMLYNVTYDLSGGAGAATAASLGLPPSPPPPTDARI